MRNIKEMEIGDHQFKIAEFTPETACYWAFRIFGTFAGEVTGLTPDCVSKFLSMHKKDFSPLYKDGLGAVSVKLESGWTSFYDENGGFAIADFKNHHIFRLLVEAFKHSLSPFFEEGLKGSLQGLFPTTGQENSSSPQ